MRGAVVAGVIAIALAASATVMTGAEPARSTRGPRDIRARACPTALATPFDDVAGNAHELAIACIAAGGITGGTAVDTYSPQGIVSRGQMASFIARILARSPNELP